MKTFNEEIENCIQQSRYYEAAELVAQKLGLEWSINFLKNDRYFDDDNDVRDIYTIGLKRGSRSFEFDFGQSLNDSQYYKDSIFINMGSEKLKLVKGKEPGLYDILCCLTKYDPGTFENFCGDFGYNEDSRKAYKTYRTVKEEYMNMCSLFTDEELKLLSLIK